MQIFIHIYTLMSLSFQWHLFCMVPKCQYIVSLHLLINFVIDISCTRVCRVSDCSPPPTLICPTPVPVNNSLTIPL